MNDLQKLERDVVETVHRRGSENFLTLAAAVALSSGSSVQVVERVIRMLLQERVLAQDAEFKIVVAKSDGPSRSNRGEKDRDSASRATQT